MSKKIKVLFMQSQSYFGADSMVHSLLMQHLDRERVQVYAACNPKDEGQPSAAFKVLQTIPDLHLRPAYFGPSFNEATRTEKLLGLLKAPATLLSLARLAWYIKRNKIDIIHGTEKPRDAFYGVRLARLTGAKSVVHLHVKCEDWISGLVRQSMGQADAIVGVSDFVAKSTVAMGYPPEKVFYVLNSLEAGRWDYTTDGRAVRREFGIGPDETVLACVARLFHWKGQTELLKALAKVKASNPAFKLLIVGEDDERGAPGRGRYSVELKALAAELGLTEQVIFTGQRRDIAQILAACDIFALPSFEEPFGVAFLEAMAMKKPVVALDSGGVGQVVDHGKAGLLSPPKDIDKLAANLLKLINDPALRRQMGDYGRRRVEEYYNPQRMAGEIEQLYRKIIG
jgi:glycosyltransferase involved in cell wall biosynthesis